MLNGRRFLLCVLTILIAGNSPVRAGEKLDSSRATASADGAVLWYDFTELGIEGKGWTETKAAYDRLPAKAENMVRGPVWSLSRQSAGLCGRFVTDAPTVSVRWSLSSVNLAMPHMAATGVSGVDLYVKSEQGWRWLAWAQVPDSQAVGGADDQLRSIRREHSRARGLFRVFQLCQPCFVVSSTRR